MSDTQANGIVLILISIILATIFYIRTKRQKFWEENGVAGIARVNKIINSGMKGYLGFGHISMTDKYGTQSIVWDLFLEIEEAGKPNRGLNIYHRFDDGFDAPQAGDKLNILIHPQKPDKIKFIPRESNG